MRLALLVAPDIKQLHANKQGNIASTETHQCLVSCVVCNNSNSNNKSAHPFSFISVRGEERGERKLTVRLILLTINIHSNDTPNLVGHIVYSRRNSTHANGLRIRGRHPHQDGMRVRDAVDTG